jgi:hypothetical protein
MVFIILILQTNDVLIYPPFDTNTRKNGSLGAEWLSLMVYILALVELLS